MTKTWAYGVTCVPERFADLLPRTLASLAAGGFGRPLLFCDRGGTGTANLLEARFGMPAVVRRGEVGPFGNWALALWELLVREPAAQRYALFQDDVVCVRGLRAYLDRCAYPDGSDGRRPGYWNLMTFLDSDNVVHDPGWVEGPTLNMGTDPRSTEQSGRGALALVFDREAVFALLGHPGFVRKPAGTDQPRARIDGCVVSVLNAAGRREYVHGPSLVSHTGEVTSINVQGKAGKRWTANARTFPGEVDIDEWMRATAERLRR